MSSAPGFPPPPPARTLLLRRGRLSYRAVGAGPRVFVLHGVNGNSRSWIPQFAAWTGRFRVIAWDAPGYGDSDVHADSPDDFAAAFAELLARTGGNAPCAVVGHSMGGVIAARCAAGAGRGQIATLVLSCSHAGRGAAPGEPLRPHYAQRLRELQTLPPLEYGRRRAKAMTPDNTAEAVIGPLAAIAAEARPDGLERALRMLQEADNAPLLPRIRAKTLVLAGEKDRTAPASKTAALLSGIAGARGVTLPNVGHAPYWEDPAAFNAAVALFLSNASAASPAERKFPPATQQP